MTLAKLGGPTYHNGRADDTWPGAARSNPQRRGSATEANMKVTRPARVVRTSPDFSPGETGSDRGTGVVTAYPERGSNPHALEGHKILSSVLVREEAVPTDPDRGETATELEADRSVSGPNGRRHSPEASPEQKRVRRRVMSRRLYRGAWANPGLMQTAYRVWGNTTRTKAGCWLWQGCVNSRGYGQMGVPVAGRRKYVSKSVHRLVALACHGEIPEGMLVCHHCDVKRCVNPAHLYIGTAIDNARDAVERGRAVNPLARLNASKTHCPHGHPYNTDNTYKRPDGSRMCRTCSARYGKLRGAE